MSLVEIARIALPEHAVDGGFDHAAVDPVADRLYVAHTSNDAVDVVDLRTRRHLRSVPGLRGVAGVWVSGRRRLLFTTNRGEDTVGVFRLGEKETESFRLPTGHRPNGIAFDEERQLLLVAGVGDPRSPDRPPTLSFYDALQGRALGRLSMPGRTRWATYHPGTDRFYVNIADPPSIVAVVPSDLARIERSFPMPARGPHGLEQAPSGDRLYCACDDGNLLALDLRSGGTARVGALAGPPDVLWLDRELGHLYAAVDEPGAVQVFGLDPPRLLETVSTADGAHTLTVDGARHEVHVFLPSTHEDLVLQDRSA
jgi:hypothetical protein